ncbi:hypothetical protein [Vitiosangium sp. GDMCC 1.1324]|uniref:hypothetical protein n=1 Tax=Vitiosangium sp. (strain GDMCC 1.1324) TaxID=2138576 RepID=UPI000D3CCABF|nr:hypothetical protein [Vitiosangium sp. GDMCC 1.1324]PTL76721.1 hypothetical protein DAT35_48195 [Vitiosangium sp. GDMCC 1.1324]
MNPRAHHTPGLLLALLLAVSACGSTVDADYQGEPLLTLEGQMTLAPGTTINGPVRIALVWYSRWFIVPLTFLNAPPDSTAVVAEDYPYEGTFPANFRFHIYRPPQSASWVSDDGTENQLATGILIAYQDGNGNGKLDTIPPTGSPVDRVLGSTMVFNADVMHTLVYTNRARTLMPGMELKPGFNLLKWAGYESESLPLSEPIPLELSAGGPLMDLLVCQGLWDGVDSQVTGGLCGIPGLADPDAEEPPPEKVGLELDVTVKRRGDRAQVAVELKDGDTHFTVKDAQVTLGGRALTYNPKTWDYELLDADMAPLLDGGTVPLDIVWGGNSYHRPLTIPSSIGLTSPAPGSHVKLESPFEVRWTRPTADDESATFSVNMVEAFEAQAWMVETNQLSYNVTLYDRWVSAGPAILEFSLWASPIDDVPDMRIRIKTVLEVPITVDP